jgi:hypothetical protein
MAQNSEKILLFKGWLLQDHRRFAVKKDWYKNFKGPVYKKSPEFSFRSGSKRPCFTGIKTVG